MSDREPAARIVAGMSTLGVRYVLGSVQNSMERIGGGGFSLSPVSHGHLIVREKAVCAFCSNVCKRSSGGGVGGYPHRSAHPFPLLTGYLLE